MIEEAHVNVFGQEFVGNAVFVNDIVVESSAAEDCSREESEDTVRITMSVRSRDGFGLEAGR